MSVSYGFHVDGLNPKARQVAFDILPKYRPAVSLYMNDLKGANQLFDACGGQTVVVHRQFQPNNSEDYWNNWKPQDWKNYYTSLLTINWGSPGIDVRRLPLLFLNEPKVSTDQIETYIDFVIDVLRWARDNRFKLVFPIPNAEIGWDTLMVQGRFDRLLKAYDDEGFRQAGHIAFIHEYSLFVTCVDMAAERKTVPGFPNGVTPDILMHPEALKKEYWATKDEVNNQYWKSNYTMFRGIWVGKRMEQLGRQPIPTIVTEASWDDMPHLWNWQGRNIKEETIKHYGSPSPSPFGGFQGAASLRPLYQKMFPDIVKKQPDDWFEQVLFDQIKHLHDVKPNYYLGFCWYALDPEDARWNSFDYSGLSKLHQKLIDWSKTVGNETPLPLPLPLPNPTPTPVPDTIPVPIPPPSSEPDPIPTQSTPIVMKDYLMGDGRIYLVENTWGGGGEIMQTQVDTNEQRRFFHVKNQYWEELWYIQDLGIYRGMDASLNGNELYQLFEQSATSRRGSMWAPWIMSIGDQVKRTPFVQQQTRDKGSNVRPGFIHTTWLKLVTFHTSRKFRSGITLQNVIELKGYVDENGKPATQPFETYFYAKNYGLVGWQGGAGESFISADYGTSRTSVMRDVVTWFNPQPIIPIYSNDFPYSNDPGWVEMIVNSNATETNIRQMPSTVSSIVDKIDQSSQHYWVLVAKAVQQSDGLWIPMMEMDKVTRGWVRSDVIKTEPIPAPPVNDQPVQVLIHLKKGTNRTLFLSMIDHIEIKVE